VAARSAVARGEVLFQANNFDAALTEFSRAYRLLAGDARRYLVLNNIAVCHERMFRYDLALQYYQRYLDEGGEQAQDRAVVARVISTLQGLLAPLEVSVNVPAELWVDARHVGQAPGTFLVPAGNHVIELRAAQYESSRHEVALTSGSRERLVVRLAQLSQFHGLHQGVFWTSVTLTAAALGVAGGYGISALNLRASARERARRDPYLNTQTDEHKISQHALFADLGYAGAALFGATSVVLYLVTDWAQHTDVQLNAHASMTHGSFELSLCGRY
jgi:tetratricopeptide (TPR) repeat protein